MQFTTRAKFMLVTNKLRSILSPSPHVTCEGHMTSSHGGGLHRDTAKPGEDKETTWDMWHFVMTLAVNFRFTNVEKLGQSIRYTNTIFQLKDS